MSWTRRELIGAMGLGPLATSRVLAAATGGPGLIRPPRLRPGDLVGLVNPASAAFETMRIEILREALESLEFRVRLGSHFYRRHGYFAGTDEERAADVNELFADPAVRMIVAFGGWGSARLLPRLDYETLRADPKVLLGFSDVTALLLGVHTKTGLVTFHGPSPRNRFSADVFRRIVMDAEAVLLENKREVPPNSLVQREDRIQTITPGRARGRILGGNLTVLTAIMASGYLPDWRDCILFLEDVREDIYRVDRMLTELSLAGVLRQIRGFVFGRCTDCSPGRGYGSLTLEQVLAEHIAPLGVPAWHGAMIGHIEEQFTIPIGLDVEIDAERGSIQLLQAAVS